MCNDDSDEGSSWLAHSFLASMVIIFVSMIIWFSNYLVVKVVH